MPLYHNDDQAMLKDSVAPFVAEQAPVSHLRKLRDSADATGFGGREDAKTNANHDKHNQHQRRDGLEAVDPHFAR